MNTTTTARQFDLIDAKSAQIEENVRTDVDLDDAFLATVREYGIMTPVLGRRDSAGKFWVRAGQRRHAAAQLLDLPLPIFFFEADDAAAAEPTWVRTHMQLIENDSRKVLPQADRIRAWSQMALEGLSVTKLAGILGETKDNVKAALTVAKSPKTLQNAAEWEIDLLSLATITEFEDDEETARDLMTVALEEPDQFDHYVARARQQVSMREAIAARVAELEAEGKTVYPHDQIGYDSNAVLRRLRDVKRNESIEVDPELGDGIAYVVAWNGGAQDIPVVVTATMATFGYEAIVWGSSSESQSGPRTEEQKAERRRVIACNKAWDATVAVRADWLTSFFARKSFPKDAGAFVAIALTQHAYDINSQNDHLAHELVGLEYSYSKANKLAELVETNPAKAGVVTLALVIGKLETGTSRNTWRYESPSARFYLRQLREWGYALAPVELIAIGEAENLPDDQNSVTDFEIEEADLTESE